MIELVKGLWVGNSEDANTFAEYKLGALLNVAQDLSGRYGWPKVEYAHVGLIDGPGNEVVAYCAAALALITMRRRHDSVLVYDHDGGRALIVAMVALQLTEGKQRTSPTAWSHWPTWGQRLGTIAGDVRAALPRPHKAHIEAFARIPFGVLEALL